MSEFLSRNNSELEQGKPELDRQEIVRLMQQLKIDITLDDLVGRDDNEVLGVVASYAISHDFDPEQVLRLRTPLESWED